MPQTEQQETQSLQQLMEADGVWEPEQTGPNLAELMAADDADVDTTPLRSPEARQMKFGMLRGEMTPENSMRVTAAGAGVLYDKPAPRGQLLASFAANPEQRRLAYEMELAKDPDLAADVRVRVGPVTGEMEYFIPSEGRYALIDPPGEFTVRGAGSFVGPAISLSSETAGGFMGMPLGVLGTAAGAAVGYFMGEFARYEAGVAMGINVTNPDGSPFNEDAFIVDKFQESLAFAGIGLGGELTITGAKALVGFVRGKVNMKELAKHFDLSMEDAAQLQDAVNAAITRNTMRFDLAQASGSPELLSLREFLKGDPAFAQEFAAFGKQQQAALNEFFDVISSPYESISMKNGDLATSMSFVQHRAQSVLDTKGMRADWFVDKAQANYDVLMNGLQGRPYESMGEPVRLAASREYAKFDAWAESAATELRELFGDEAFIPNSNVHSVVSKLDKEANEALFAFTSRQIKALIGDPRVTKVTAEGAMEVDQNTLELLMSEKELAEFGNVLFDPDGRMTFGQTWKALSSLKAVLRRTSRGTDIDTPEAGTVKMLIDALEKDLRHGAPDSSYGTAYDNFIRTYAVENRRVNKGVAEKILARQEGPNSPYMLETKEVWDDVFGGKLIEPARQLRDLIGNDPTAMDAVRQSFINNWKRTVLRPTADGSVPQFNQAAHKLWLEAHEDQAKLFFNGNELKSMRNGAGFDRALRARKAARDQVQQELNASFEGELTNINRPELIANRMLNGDDVGYATRVMELMDGALPEHARAVRAGVKQKFHQKVTTPGGELSLRKLTAALEGTGNISKNLEAIFGKQYVDDLTTLHSALKMAEQQASSPNFSNTAIAQKALTDLARAYVGIFTTPGRVLTAFSRIRGRAANQTIMSVMLEPRDLRRLIELKDVGRESRAWTELMIQTGATAMLADFDSISAERSKPDFEDRRIP